jgi:leader peptidase (prepilin peptidase)/N-methyltransferase
MFIALWSVIGVFIGSLAAVAGRALMDRPNARAFTKCDLCRRTKAWWELIPFFSYIGLGGKCRSCGTTILVTDFAMEVVGGILLGVGAARFGNTRDFVWWVLFALFTLLIFYVDLRWMVVPRSFAVVTAFVTVLAQWSSGSMLMVMLSALLGCIFYFFLYAISNGKWVGSGDVGLGFIIGAAAATPTQLGLLLLLAHGVGAVIAALLLKMKHKELGDALPLGAFLLPAAWVVVLIYGWLR